MSAATAGIDTATVLETFLRLVRIDSPSGDEAALIAALEPELRRLGFETWRDTPGNLLARRPGRGSTADAAPLIFSAHLDTVEPGRGIKPRVEDGVVRSDGTTILGADDKAGIAAILEGVRAADAGGTATPCRPLELILTVEEETGLIGAKGLDVNSLKGRQAIVLDSDGPVGKIVNQAPAADLVDAVVTGKAAHAGVAPEEGINALVATARALAEMRLGRIDPETTANFGVFSGGTAVNVVPEHVELKGEARSRSEDRLRAQSAHMTQRLQAAAAAVGATAEVTVTRAYSSIDLPPASPLIRFVEDAVRACGLEPFLAPTGGGSDANIFNAAGIETVNLGTGYRGAHSVDEHIPVADLGTLTGLVRTLITAP
jgi:tripeptide aminopeptidase